MAFQLPTIRRARVRSKDYSTSSSEISCGKCGTRSKIFPILTEDSEAGLGNTTNGLIPASRGNIERDAVQGISTDQLGKFPKRWSWTGSLPMRNPEELPKMQPLSMVPIDTRFPRSVSVAVSGSVYLMVNLRYTMVRTKSRLPATGLGVDF